MATAKKKTTAKKTKTKKSETIGFTTSNVFEAPIKKVWDAATEKKHLKKYFVDDMIGKFGPKLEPVKWIWKQWEEGAPIQPTVYQKHKKLEFKWPGWPDMTPHTVTFDFLRKNNKTIFRITETGFKKDDLKSAFMTCEGWTEFHCYLKAHLFHKVSLRTELND